MPSVPVSTAPLLHAVCSAVGFSENRKPLLATVYPPETLKTSPVIACLVDDVTEKVDANEAAERQMISAMGMIAVISSFFFVLNISFFLL